MNKVFRTAAEMKRAILEIFGSDTFTPSTRRSLTTEGQFTKKAQAMARQTERHDKRAKRTQLRIGRIGARLSTLQMLLAIKDIASDARFRRKLLNRPRTAAMLAEEFKTTKDAEYFAKIAKEAAKRAKNRRNERIIAKIAARRREIQLADRQWAEKAARAKKQIARKL